MAVPDFQTLMIEYGVGVSEGETLKIKKLDEDYVSGEQ